jgi:nucleoid-associated protein YgaU
MMRNRSRSVFRSYLLPAIAAIVLAVGPVACSSTGEEEPTPALDGAASGEATENGNAANNNAAAGENGNINANTEAANTARPEGEAASSNNPIGNELNNAIGGEGNELGNTQAAAADNESAGAPENGAVADNGALNAEGSGNALNALAADANGTGAAPAPDAGAAPVAGAADANTTNPFGAVGNNAAPAPAPENSSSPAFGSAEAAPANVDSAAEAGSGAETEGEEGDSTSAVVSGPTSLPEIGSKMAYYVMRGDTLGGIAQKIYGSRGRWKSLQAENGLADANKIYPGDVIYYTLTEASKAFAEKYEKGDRQAYTVSKGDTLSGIAAKFFGTQSAWRVLWKENPQVLNPDRIRVGMVLTYRAANKVALKDDEDAELEVADNESTSDDQGDEAVEVLTAAVE